MSIPGIVIAPVHPSVVLQCLLSFRALEHFRCVIVYVAVFQW